jgi:hypothetical protein
MNTGYNGRTCLAGTGERRHSPAQFSPVPNPFINHAVMT